MVCLGFEPEGGRMKGANESTELRRHPDIKNSLFTDSHFEQKIFSETGLFDKKLHLVANLEKGPFIESFTIFFQGAIPGLFFFNFNTVDNE